MIDLNEIKKNIFKKENFYFLIIIFLVFCIDRYSKIKIINNFSGTSFYLNDFLNLNLLWNTGIGFGILSSTTGYISIKEQLDQLYHDMEDGKLGAAATTGSWYVGITSVKNAFPKLS